MNFDEDFLNFMESLETEKGKVHEKDVLIETFQYTTRSFLCKTDINKIPNVLDIKINKISKFITEIIFTCRYELNENTKKKFGLRRSYKLL